MCDSQMPAIMAELVKAYYLGLGRSVKDLVNYVESKNPLKVANPKGFYQHKLKEFLLAVAFGMQAAKPWDGTYETHGGYIIVKENGELACYHVYERDRFKEYLYFNTKFDTPGRSRHNYGKVYKKDGKKFILLNFQIRFID